jgi:hypothetical protein
LSTELGWAYDVLGVKPGVSDRELKAAHRDLAKVWHPDRFLHDPRLQEKAQEKLKEINEAYEQLISRHQRRVPTPPRSSPPPPSYRAQTTPAEVVVPTRRGIGWHWYVAASLVVFAVVFALTTQKLVRRQQPIETTEVEESIEQPADARQETAHTVRNRTENDSAPATEAVSETAAPASETVPAVQTVTVVIDPASGLLATPSCPVKSRMTYPSGSEPRGHCNITHIVKPEKENGIKGLAKRIL